MIISVFPKILFDSYFTWIVTGLIISPIGGTVFHTTEVEAIRKSVYPNETGLIVLNIF